MCKPDARARVPAATGAESSFPPGLEAMLDIHAADLLTMACAMLLDRGSAETATVGAFLDAWTSPVRAVHDVERRELARCLHARCQRPRQISGTGPRDVPCGMEHLRVLTDQQRVVLALAKYGELSYRQVGELVDLPAPAVADLMSSGLRSLDPTHPA